VQEDEDRRIGLVRSKDIELFDLYIAVGVTQRLADAGPGASAVADPAFAHLFDIGFVRCLVIGGV
jgi:hypothetical protein